MAKRTKLILEGDEAKELVLAAIGNPYLIIVEKDDNVYSKVTNGFDVGLVFEWIKRLAKEDKAFKEALADFVIDLSKEC